MDIILFSRTDFITLEIQPLPSILVEIRLSVTGKLTHPDVR